MTDKINLVHEGDTLDDARLELITDYLMGSLDQAQVEDVKRRLETDAEFRAYCAPVILAWSVPPKHEREPMSRAQLAKHWDTFTKRAGFVHQRRKARRRRWMLFGVIAIVLATSYMTLRRTVTEWYHDRRDFHAVAPSTDWIQIGEGRDVALPYGSRLRVANKPDSQDVLAVHLTGTARFRTRVTDTNVVAPQVHTISVDSRAGSVMLGYGELTVTVTGDTATAESHQPNPRQFMGIMPLPTIAVVTGNTDRNPFRLNEGQRARVVRGQKPTILP